MREWNNDERKTFMIHNHLCMDKYEWRKLCDEREENDERND